MAYVPENTSTYGFFHAPISRFLLVSSVAATTSVSFLPRSYQSLMKLNLIQVVNKGQVWRLIPSMFVIDSSLQLICKCFLIYHFIIIERRWGSSKYLSFILTNWLICLGMYGVLFKSGLFAEFVPSMIIVPSGFYGPLFAMLVYYYKTIKSDDGSGVFGLPVSKKSFVYMIAVQLMFVDERSAVLSVCGLLSGVLYYNNFLNMQRWLKIPRFIIKPLEYLFSFGQSKSTDEPFSRQTLMGATPQIHDDIVFDHITQRQQRVLNRNDHNTTARMGQGYSDVMNPSFAQLFSNIVRPPPTPPPPTMQSPLSQSNNINQPSEENIQVLIDMGFSRDAVHDALLNSGDDIQQATSILLSSAVET